VKAWIAVVIGLFLALDIAVIVIVSNGS